MRIYYTYIHTCIGDLRGFLTLQKEIKKHEPTEKILTMYHLDHILWIWIIYHVYNLWNKHEQVSGLDAQTKHVQRELLIIGPWCKRPAQIKKIVINKRVTSTSRTNLFACALFIRLIQKLVAHFKFKLYNRRNP